MTAQLRGRTAKSGSRIAPSTRLIAAVGAPAGAGPLALEVLEREHILRVLPEAGGC
ncbi:MAG TPA: hypothetical protein VN317_03080 [Candidatus Methanoperedens sp.]|nr:hypothetical protein [Candidatus Methanoperedens sp.]